MLWGFTWQLEQTDILAASIQRRVAFFSPQEQAPSVEPSFTFHVDSALTLNNQLSRPRHVTWGSELRTECMQYEDSSFPSSSTKTRQPDSSIITVDGPLHLMKTPARIKDILRVGDVTLLIQGLVSVHKAIITAS